MLALVAWLAAAEVDVSAVEVVQAADGERALRARRTVRTGEEVLRIPWKFFVTTIQAWATPAGLDLPAKLAAHLLAVARDESSPYRPYIESLPRNLDHLPLYWGADELSLLRGSQLLDKIALLREDLERDLDMMPGVTREELSWAFGIATSRAFGVTIEGNREQVLIPLVDMMNHSDVPCVQGGFDAEDGAYVINALRDVTGGEELLCRYSRNCNSYYLLGYGFCQADNPDNTAVVRFDGRNFVVRASPAGREELIRYLRRALPVAARDELAVSSAIIAVAREALARFDTTIEEDDALLAGALSRTRRACILFRRGEKRVLHACADLSDGDVPA